MKKIFTLFAVASMAAVMNAQVVVMLDPTGKEYANGSTITIAPTVDGEGEEAIVEFAAPSIKNTSAADVDVKLKVKVTSIPENTSVRQCFAGKCFSYESVVEEETGVVPVAAGAVVSTATEWECYDGETDAYLAHGECVVEFTIYEGTTAGNTYTVKYSLDAASLEGIKKNATVVETYTMLGQKAAVNQKGVMLQKMSDGTIRKVVLK